MYTKDFYIVKKHLLIILLVFLASGHLAVAQPHYRIQANFSVKEVKSDGSQSLSMGRVFYDLHHGKVVFDIYYPSPHQIVLTNTHVYIIHQGKVTNTSKAPNMLSFSIFNLSMKGSLPYYGLQDTPFELQDIERVDSMVISTWQLPEALVKSRSKLLLSQVDRRLQGLVTFDEDGELVSRQLFENYTTVQGLSFPRRVVQFVYTADGSKDQRITTYSNIMVNNSTSNENMYHFRLPDH